jgi:hypothetical protein
LLDVNGEPIAGTEIIGTMPSSLDPFAKGEVNLSQRTVFSGMRFVAPLPSFQNPYGINWLDVPAVVEASSAVDPTLRIATAGSEVVVSWPTNGTTGYQLESAPSLTSPVTWSSNGPPPVVVGELYMVTNAVVGSQKWYRLAK